MVRRLGVLSPWLVLCLCLNAAPDAAVVKGKAPLPDGVAEGVKAAVSQESLTVSLDGSPMAHFWLRPLMPSADTPSSELGVSFGQIKSGSLLGVVQFVAEWSDYKTNPIAPGVYTLRYEHMPSDGNHMGVAIYRDFALLVPATEDQDPEAVLSYDQLVEVSAKSTGVPHPGVVALFPIWDPVEEATVLKNEVDQLTFAVKFGDQVVGFVLAGHGEM